MPHRSIVLALLALAPLPSPAQQALDALVQEVHDEQRNVGLAVAIQRGGEAVYERYLGMADLEHGVAVQRRTRFGIASVTKLFTATALLVLRGKGAVDLEAAVQQYVPEFPVKPEGAITLRMLATHRSGLPHPRNRTPELFATHYETATEALEVFATEPLGFVPDSRAGYSTSNYNLLAAVLERVEGASFSTVLTTRILAPLGLEHTALDDVLRPLPDRSRRYSYYHPWTYAESEELYRVPDWDYSFNAGGGNLTSTAVDLARFGQSLTEPALLSLEDFELLLEWCSEQDAQGRRRVFVSGSNPGVQAALTVYPEGGLSVAVLANTWGVGSRSGEMVRLASRLAEVVLETR